MCWLCTWLGNLPKFHHPLRNFVCILNLWFWEQGRGASEGESQPRGSVETVTCFQLVFFNTSLYNKAIRLLRECVEVHGEQHWSCDQRDWKLGRVLKGKNVNESTYSVSVSHHPSVPLLLMLIQNERDTKRIPSRALNWFCTYWLHAGLGMGLGVKKWSIHSHRLLKYGW